MHILERFFSKYPSLGICTEKGSIQVIKSFADQLTEDLFHGVHTHVIRKKLSMRLVKEAQRKLDLLNVVEDLESLRTLPSHKVELVRDVGGKYSIPVHRNWRILFRWNKDPEDVEIKG